MKGKIKLKKIGGFLFTLLRIHPTGGKDGLHV